MRIDIIFGILLTLLNKGNTTASDLSNKFEISTKTVYRYLTILDSNSIPIVTKKGKNGGIFLNNTYTINHAFFTKTEKDILLELSNLIENNNIKTSIKIKLNSI